METELINFLKFVDEVYGVFGLTYEMALSTRPEGYLGEIEIWDQVRGGIVNKHSTDVELHLTPPRNY
jgi:threonyl-tRNA synthetase